MSNLCVFPVLAGSRHSVVGMKKKPAWAMGLKYWWLYALHYSLSLQLCQ